MRRWILIFMWVASTSCSPKVVSYLNEKADFKSFETYRIVTAKTTSATIKAEHSQVFDMIKNQIQSQMDKRGYKLSNISPDLTLRYEVASSTRTEVNNNQVNPFFWPTVPLTSRTLHQAVILLEMKDQNNRLIWQGSYDMNQEKKEKRVAQALENAIGKIFTTYPYRAASSQVDESLKTISKPRKK